MLEVTCKWPNVWTSDGRKLVKGETAPVSDEDAKTFRELGAAELKRGRKKESKMGRNYTTANRIHSSENVTTGAASAATGAAPAQVYLARVAARSNPMFVAVGSAATVNSTFFPVNHVEVLQVSPGETIAAIQDGGAGEMNVTWLTN